MLARSLEVDLHAMTVPAQVHHLTVRLRSVVTEQCLEYSAISPDSLQHPHKARLGMLALAEELQNIRLPCQTGRDFPEPLYEIKAAFEKCGAEGRRRANASDRGCPTRRRRS